MELNQTVEGSKPIPIGSGQDLDTYVKNNTYHQDSNSNATGGSNYPVNKAGLLIVESHDVMIYQTYKTYDGTGVYTRSKYSNDAWTAWSKNFSQTEKPTATDVNAVPNRTRSNWNDGTILDSVVGMMPWRHYGTGHVIFDASKSLSPEGDAVNNANAEVPWTATYPALMGWNGNETYGLRVDSARTADMLDQKPVTTFLNMSSGSSVKDPNIATEPYILSNHANTPGEGAYWHIHTSFWSTITATSNRTQVATKYNGGTGMFVRSCYGQTWTAWVRCDNSQSLPLAGGMITGELFCNGWYRTNGDKGWYNHTHGGGIYMNEATTVKVYNGKQFQVDNDIRAIGDVIAFYSDERLKTNITEIEDATSIIMSWNPMKYTANDLASKLAGYDTEKWEVGLGAQTVGETAPELVAPAPFDYCPEEGSLSGEYYKTLRYERSVVYLTKALQEQITIGNERESRIETLEAEVSELKTMMQELLKSKGV